MKSVCNNKPLFDILQFGGYFFDKRHPCFNNLKSIRELINFKLDDYFDGNPQMEAIYFLTKLMIDKNPVLHYADYNPS